MQKGMRNCAPICLAKASHVNERIYGAKTAKYVKLIGGRRVSVDLSINSVVCRDAGGEWSYELLMENPLRPT